MTAREGLKCAVKGAVLQLESSPARQLLLRPVATEAAVEVTTPPEPLVQRVVQATRRACRP